MTIAAIYSDHSNRLKTIKEEMRVYVTDSEDASLRPHLEQLEDIASEDEFMILINGNLSDSEKLVKILDDYTHVFLKYYALGHLIKHQINSRKIKDHIKRSQIGYMDPNTFIPPRLFLSRIMGQM